MLSIPSPMPLTDPSAVLLNPWETGEPSNMGLAAVSPVRVAFAAAASIRDARACESAFRGRLGEVDIDASVVWS